MVVRPPRRREPPALLLFAALVLLVLAPGCGSAATAPVKSTSPVKSPTSGPPSGDGGGAPIVLAGNNTGATNEFPLKKGLAVFSLIYSGDAAMRATLLDAAGAEVSRLFNVNAAMNGSTALGVGDGRYSISVTGTGPWNLQVRQGVEATPQPLPLSASGTGPLVTPFFRSNGGNATASMSYSGSAPFSATVLTSGGEVAGELANRPNGPFRGTGLVTLEAGVVYTIDVEGVGPWTLSLQ